MPETINLKAKVIDTTTFCFLGLSDEPRVGDIVTLTRDDRHRDGTVATDTLGTWGRIGINYELLEQEDTNNDT